VYFLQEKYTFDEMKKKLESEWNQAYVETVASYIVGKLRQEDVTPHFNLYYGAFKSIAEKYSYNITDEVETYRKYKWFWNGIEKGDMSIDVEVDDEVIKAELLSEIMEKPEYCIELNHDDSLEEQLETLNINKDVSDELQDLESIHSFSIKTVEEDNNEEEDDDDKEDEEEEEESNVYMNLKEFPVMMIFTEKNEATMDSLLDDNEEVGADIDTPEWEERWTAWLFQVIASLCVVQTLFKFTHNDLHTNNIVYENTDKKYLYYQTQDKKVYKVPTFGKIFKIIDFGRSIFSLNEHLFISDDFSEGNDADTQYNFEPLIKNPSEQIVYPNMSFDLSRLAISLFEELFDETPKEKPNAKILSNEKNRVVKETVSELYNMLWSWLIDDKGENILFDEDDDERFPDFGLYVHIAAHCKNAVPKEQLKRPLFEKYVVKSYPDNLKIYSLYI